MNKDDQEKLDYTLLPATALAEVVRVLEFGAKKYGRDNWRTVPDLNRRYTAAAMRHLFKMSEGEAYDNESELSHAAHVVCCMMFILNN